jgi:hypothetical protein
LFLPHLVNDLTWLTHQTHRLAVDDDFHAPAVTGSHDHLPVANPMPPLTGLEHPFKSFGPVY